MKKDPKKSVEDEILAGMAGIDKTRAEASATHGAVAVRVSDDKLTAYVVVPSPSEAEGINKNNVLEALAKAGVKYGIAEKEIDEIFTFGSFSVDVPIAKGKPPSNGTPAVIEYKFDTGEGKKKGPVEDEHGNVDLRELNIVSSVDEGALLAVKTPAVAGETGTNVLGETLAAVDGRDVKLPVGENTKAGDDGVTVYAGLSGQPILKDGKIAVSPVFEVRGDVNYGTGNLKFIGSIIVRGNIQNDFTVEASDDVDIFGNIEKAFIIAGGDVRIRGGIYGGGTGYIKAGGSINIRTVESAVLEASENIVITQSARHSTLSAGNDIMLENPKGSIVGGKASSGHMFIVANLGAPSFAETLIEIGMNPKLKKAYDELQTRITDHKVQLEKAVRTIKTIKDLETQGQPITPDKHALLAKLIPAAHQIKAILDTDQAKVDFLTEKLKSLKAGRARVNYKCYPGVKILSMNSKPFTVRSEINHSSFYEQNEQIIVATY